MGHRNVTRGSLRSFVGEDILFHQRLSAMPRLRDHDLRSSPHRPCRVGGFTLIEVLCVLAILAVLATFTMPALSSLAIGTGRRGAIHILMNGIEQARITAVEQCSNVYLGFADKNFPDSQFAYNRFILFRERDPERDPAVFESNYVLLTTWISLPRNTAIASLNKSVVGSNVNRAKITAGDGFPGMPGGGKLPVICFNPSGTVESPGATDLQIFVYEGFYTDKDNFLRRGNPGESVYDKIGISKYTGRPQLEILSRAPR